MEFETKTSLQDKFPCRTQSHCVCLLRLTLIWEIMLWWEFYQMCITPRLPWQYRYDIFVAEVLEWWCKGKTWLRVKRLLRIEKRKPGRRLSALYALTAQMARFGPTLAFRMSFFSVRTLPWGIGAAGAESVKEGVHSGNEEGKSLNQDNASSNYLVSHYTNVLSQKFSISLELKFPIRQLRAL